MRRLSVSVAAGAVLLGVVVSIFFAGAKLHRISTVKSTPTTRSTSTSVPAGFTQPLPASSAAPTSLVEPTTVVPATAQGSPSTTNGAVSTTLAAAIPAISSINLQSVLSNQPSALWIYGTNLSTVTSVSFGGVQVPVLHYFASEGALEVQTPVRSPGTVDVRLVSAAGESLPTSGDLLTFEPAPVGGAPAGPVSLP